MATATLPPPVQLIAPSSPRNFLKENMEEVRELSELNREKHEAEAEKKRLEEEEAILKEMGLLDKKPKSRAASRSNSRSNSPSKINLRSRSNSPSAILHFQNIPSGSREFINEDRKPVTHKSRLQSVSKSQPQSNDSSPKHSKIPKRQSSVSPSRGRLDSKSKSSESLNKRLITNSNSSIHETIKIGSQVHDKRAMSKSTQHLDISPGHIMGKPPISPGRGPPPVNKTISAKRLSPIVGTPNKSPTDDIPVPKTTKPTPAVRRNVKTTGSTPATSRLNSKPASRDPSPEKRKGTVANTSKTSNPATRTASMNMKSKPTVPNKVDPKTSIKRTSSVKSLTRTPSTKTLNEKPPLLKNASSKKDLTDKTPAFTKINEVGKKNINKDIRKPITRGREPATAKKGKLKNDPPKNDTNETNEENKQNDETDDKISNLPTELVLMTKKNIVSMTAAAITSQPLEVVAKVTSQLPVVLEKAREKGIFERLNSKDSLAPKEEEKEKEKEKEKTKPKEPPKIEAKEVHKEKESKDTNEMKEEKEHIKPHKANHDRTIFIEDNIKLRPLQPPYNNPYVERVKQKIDDILKEPEVSRENILTASAKSRETKFIEEKEKPEDVKEMKEVKEIKEATEKITELKNETIKENDKVTSEIRSEATKIVNSIITPVEEPKEVVEQPPKAVETKIELRKEIEPIVTVVNEKKKIGTPEVVEKNETVIGEPEVEVQSSNVSTPAVDKMVHAKGAEGSGSDKSVQSNGG